MRFSVPIVLTALLCLPSCGSPRRITEPPAGGQDGVGDPGDPGDEGGAGDPGDPGDRGDPDGAECRGGVPPADDGECAVGEGAEGEGEGEGGEGEIDPGDEGEGEGGPGDEGEGEGEGGPQEVVCDLGTKYPDRGPINPDDPDYEDARRTKEMVREMFAEAKANNSDAYRAYKIAYDNPELMECGFCPCHCDISEGHKSGVDCFKDLHGFW